MDELDRARMRLAWTAVAAVVGAGLGGALAAAWLEECCNELGGVVFLPIVPAWSVALGVAAGRWLHTRRLGAGAGISLLLAWLAAHFVVPDFQWIYIPLLDPVLDGGWGPTGVLGLWALVALLMVVVVLGAERLVDRVE